jgi:uncharacterized protein (TIGR00369 family)
MSGKMAPPKLARKEMWELLRRDFPEMSNAMGNYELDELWFAGCRVRYPFVASSLRPGGTLSGSTMMSLADFAMYIAVLSAIGWVPLAVTTNLNINFLRKPKPRDLVAEARLIKLGRRLAVGDISIRSLGEDDLVAHATSTYSIPDHNDREYQNTSNISY